MAEPTTLADWVAIKEQCQAALLSGLTSQSYSIGGKTFVRPRPAEIKEILNWANENIIRLTAGSSSNRASFGDRG